MEDRDERIAGPRTILYGALVAFVLAWILGPSALRSAIPIWLPFLVALGLELAFVVGAFRTTGARTPDRGPQPTDRELYGWAPEDDDGDETDGAGDDDAGDAFEIEAIEPRRRSPFRGFLVGLGVIGALAVGVWALDSRSGWDGLDREQRAAAMERFSEEASIVAEKPVSVRCDEAGDFVGVIQHADGAAAVGGDTAYLTPAICHTLYRLAFESQVAGSRTGRAIAVLAHEAWHLRGVRDEGETECYALQSGVAVGQRLGLSEERARQLMRQQLTENALRSGSSFEYRVPPECRPGGRFDLSPDDPRFP